MAPRIISADSLVRDYDALLIDAYGVLVDSGGGRAGAVPFIERLRAEGLPFVVVTNDASKLPSTCAARFAELGLRIDDDQIITSGGLLAAHFAASGLAGAKTLVLGPPDSARYVADAGGLVVLADQVDDSIEAVVIGDESGYPFLEAVDATLTALYGAIDAGRPPALILPNPDLVYPKSAEAYGIASGSVALILEAALAARYRDAAPRFTRLGKPHAPIYEAALAVVGTRRAVMIGDQLDTDIAGANAVGIDSALLTSGVGRWSTGDDRALPTYLLRSLG